MDAILNFLGGIGDAIVSVFDFLIGLVSDLVYMVQLTGKVLAQIPSYFSWLPDSVVAMIVTLLALAALFKILGREG